MARVTASRATLGIKADEKQGNIKMYALDTDSRYVPLLGSM